MNIKGKVKAVLPIENGTSKAGNPYSKGGFVITTEGQYPKDVAFTLFGDKVSLCPKVGEEVDVHFDLSSREYNGKWFHDIQAWKIDRPQANTQIGTLPPQPSFQSQDAPF